MFTAPPAVGELTAPWGRRTALPLLTNPSDTLPADPGATLVGRVHDPGEGGPSVVAVRGDQLVDLSDTAPTVTDLLEHPDPAAVVRSAAPRGTWSLARVLENTLNATAGPTLLPPADLQVIKAAGVTFVNSMLERVIEEKAAGDASRSSRIRGEVEQAIGSALSDLVPGSEQARAVKASMVRDGLWSQYLEVGLGPDPEIFTKAPVLSAVGHGAEVGIAEGSEWNNPEPEVVLALRADGTILGATLGNDVNLRDIEGRSALLLPKAKDNNASAALGPFLRLDVRLEVLGDDGFRLDGFSSMREISRDPLDLARAPDARRHLQPASSKDTAGSTTTQHAHADTALAGKH